MRKQTTCYSCDKPIEPEWLPEGEFTICDECSLDTDKLSVEKLQEQLNTAKKALTEISVIPTKFDDGGAGEIAVEISHDALAAIGGDDE
jgi:hypothetical protein